MASKDRRKHEKAMITDGADQHLVNGKLFFTHGGHYVNYEFTAMERDKFWGLRVMLALNYAIWSLVHYPIPGLSSDSFSLDDRWRGAVIVYGMHLEPSQTTQCVLGDSFRAFSDALVTGNQHHRLKSSAAFAWNLGLEALKVDPPTDVSFFQASAYRMLWSWLNEKLRE
jgi:hypothetical protein